VFAEAAKQWLATKTALSPFGQRYYRQYVRKLNAYLDKRLVTELTPGDVASLQRLRQAKGLSGRQINAEVGTLRAILRYHGHWSRISGRIRMLRQNLEAGRALSVEETDQLFAAILGSRSAALFLAESRRWIAALRNPLAAAVERTRLLVRQDHERG
jgi:hypothetical protein